MPINLINCDRSRPLSLNYLSWLLELIMYILNRYLHDGCCGLGCVIRWRNNDLSFTRKQDHLKRWYISTRLDGVTTQRSGIRCHGQSGKNQNHQWSYFTWLRSFGHKILHFAMRDNSMSP
jgi:hypothetical protein